MEKNEQVESKELQVSSGNELEATKVTRATLSVVKNTIFPTATDDELALFVHKCIACGCHPLDGMIHPSKFKVAGQDRVVFISSIDYFRSSAEDTGLYDGQDEPEYEWADEENDKFPIRCKVSVYKQGIGRPFVGIADWEEFFPADAKKQFMYKKMPRVMIAKCAEAQAFRKAFPKKLNKLYVEEEMYQASNINNNNSGSNSTKPAITQTTESTADAGQTDKKPISEGQVKRIYGMCKGNKVDVEKLKLWLKESKGIGSLKDISWENKEYETICEAIEKNSKAINSYVTKVKSEPVTPETKTTTGVETALDHEDFKKHIQDLAEKAEVGDIDLDLKFEFSIDKLDDVPADKQEKVIAHFLAKVNKK